MIKSRKRILIIGGNGFVGGHLVLGAIRREYEIAVAGTAEKAVIPGIPYYLADISKEKEILEIGRRVNPHIIINCAAVSNIDYAQKEKEIAFAINAVGAGNGAKAAKRLGSQYVWFSSDAVYEGTESTYLETSETKPVNYYGETKLEGEHRILQELPTGLILRISWILGFPSGGRDASLGLIRKKMLGKETVYASNLEMRSPIDVLTLCDCVYELLGLEKNGIYNLGSTDWASRPVIMEMIGKAYEYEKDRITVIGEGNGAKRHKNGILTVDKACQDLKKTKLKTVKETVASALQSENVR